MKYVIIKMESETPRVYAFTFSERLTHSEMARAFQRGVEREFRHPCTVYSAGFCETGSMGFYVTEHGSESLHIDKNKQQGNDDESILNQPSALQDMLL